MARQKWTRKNEKAAVQMLVSMNADAMLYGTDVEACIFCDYYEGGRMATEYMIENGCKNIVCIKDPQHRYSARTRYQGYLDVCREHDIPERTVECDHDFNQGMTMTEELLRRFPNVDGIIACNDIVAIST